METTLFLRRFTLKLNVFTELSAAAAVCLGKVMEV